MGKMTEDMDNVIAELKKQGVSYTTTENEVVGLGDVVENVLNTFGITQERFKAWFNLKACNCDERKKYLNNLFSWHVKKNIDKTE
jgi:hypothetical protein